MTIPQIAYFSMEYGFHNSLKIYSGGLGILAGDYLKEASDHKVNIVGIGLLYRYGYFTQLITTRGEQQAIYDFQHFSKLPIKPVKDDKGKFQDHLHCFAGPAPACPDMGTECRTYQTCICLIRILRTILKKTGA